MNLNLNQSWFLNGGGSSVDLNRQFVLDNFSWFIDFHTLKAMTEDDPITDDVIDLTGNGYDLEDAAPASVGGAKIGKTNLYETEVTCAKMKQTTASPYVLMFKQGMDSLFNNNGDFEFWCYIACPAGSTTIDLMGFLDNTDSGVVIQVNSQTVQILLFSGSVTLANETAWESEILFPASPTPFTPQLLRFKVNKSGAVNPKIYLNGVERTMSLKTGGWGAFSNWTPSPFDSGNLKPALGGYNLAGALRNRIDREYMIPRAGLINRVLTDEEAQKVLLAFTTFD